MIETVDEHFGRVLDTLERAGEDLDEWVIVFCSDHGEMLGQHGVWEKPHFYEPCAGVPLVVRYPERFDAGTVDANVTLCDLFATLCDLANVPLPEEHALDSRSLVPLLEGDRAAWDGRHADEAVSAYGDEVMIKHGDLKYVHVEGERNALFDLGVDPEETANRIDDPDYADEVAEFESRRGELGYGPNGGSGYAGAGYDPGV
jgi:choline-sulfatase